jgi:Domain of unknown function (DUF3127)
MDIRGKVNKMFEIQTFKNGFKKRELVIITDDKYPQSILVEFIQDKIKLLADIKEDDYVKISFNLRGREWINKNGITKYINSIQGWKIEKINNVLMTKEKNKDYLESEESEEFEDINF